MKKIFPSLFAVFILLAGIFFSCQKEISCEDCKTNKPPIAIAGLDKFISLPTDSVSLDGSSSKDPDGNISEWLWKKISGPASFNIVHSTDSITRVKALVTGIYQFELSVKDNGGLVAKDTIQVTVNGGPTNHPPIANAGFDTTIILPENTANLDGGRSTDPDNNITSYSWTKISGPSSFDISNANSVQTQVNSLAEGTYEFELQVKDADGLLDRDTVKVFVLSPPVPPVSGDVYVAGSAGGNAVYWKNGTTVSLTNGTNWAEANDIAISGTDVYVAGSENNGTKLEAKYWKNGIPVTLAGGSVATAIAVSGSDVYVAGYEDNGTSPSTSVAKYWKNGIPISLTDGSQLAAANGIAVSGSDVYVVGVEESNTSDIKFARFWKNGTPVSLENGTNYAEANDITISGSDIYIAGSVGGEAVYWKNGNYINLSGISNAFLAGYGIAVSGSDVYVAGLHDINGGAADFGTATYWKNTIPIVLSSVIFSGAADIAVSGSDVYVAGYEDHKAMYWKNGIPVVLTDGRHNAAALAIAVVP